MSFEQTIIKQAYPHVVTARARELFRKEMLKGCSLKISPVPLAIEARYCPISQILVQTKSEQADNIPEPIVAANELKIQSVWLAPDEEFSWLSSELFLKHLREVSHRIGFEIVGNKQKIDMRFLVHRNDLPILKAAFRGQFKRCEIADSLDNRALGPPPRILSDLVFNDYFPHPPYSYLLTRPDELQVTTYQSLFAALMEIEPPALGFYQVFFQPVKPDHNWHRNVQGLLDLEYNIKLMSGGQSPQRIMQQAPSGDLRQMSWELETKAHNDKPFFSTAIRLGVFFARENSDAYIGALSAFMNLFQHGGRSLDYITEKDYSKILGLDSIFNMFLLGITYRPGFLLNSGELTGVVHIPPADILTYRQPPITLLETLPIPSSNLQKGTPLGTYEYAGKKYPICIPPDIRSRSSHIIARPGQTKSTTMALMSLDDFEKEYGGAVIDPHGDLIETLLCSIKEKDIERTIYFNPGLSDYVPIWNLLKKIPGQDISRTADDVVAALKKVVTGWGDRMEHLLRHGIYGLLHLPNSTLLDLSNLLRGKSKESERLQKEIIKVVDNKSALEFWNQDFNRYSNEALGPPKHKLSKLLVSGNLSLMFSQPESLIDFRQIMDEGKILLINLSTIGSETREIVGCFILSLLHLSALSRSDTPPKDRKNFPIYVDESHRFITGAMEDIIAELRKFGSHAVYAHHYFSQFGTKKIDALSSVGSTIIMNVDGKDARYLTKDLMGLVNHEDLISLKVGEAIARIGTEIVKVRLNGPLEIPEHHHKDEIIKRSLERYYKPSHVIRKFLQSRDKRCDHAFETLTTSKNGKIEEFFYDEF